MADNQQILWCSADFPNNEFQSPKHHKRKPDMKQHEKHHKICSSPNMKPQTHCETTVLGPSIVWGPQSHPTRNTPDMKRRHPWWDFQLQQLSRLQARDVLPDAATMLFHVGFGFIGGFWSSDSWTLGLRARLCQVECCELPPWKN